MEACGARLFSSGRLSSPDVSSGVKGAGGLKEPSAGPRPRSLPGDVLIAREEKALRLTWWSRFWSLMSSRSRFRLCGDGCWKKFMLEFVCRCFGLVLVVLQLRQYRQQSVWYDRAEAVSRR